MKIRTYILTSILLCSCAPQYQYQSPETQITQKCTEAGFNEKELSDCISAGMKSYEKEIAKQEAEAKKRQAAMKKAQLTQDRAKCKEYGLKQGTKDFASCMMTLETAREQGISTQAQSQPGQMSPALKSSIAQYRMMAASAAGSRDTMGGATQWTPLLEMNVAQKSAELASQLAAEGWDANSINMMLQVPEPPQPKRPRRIDCDRFGNGFSCTEW